MYENILGIISMIFIGIIIFIGYSFGMIKGLDPKEPYYQIIGEEDNQKLIPNNNSYPEKIGNFNLVEIKQIDPSSIHPEENFLAIEQGVFLKYRNSEKEVNFVVYKIFDSVEEEFINTIKANTFVEKDSVYFLEFEDYPKFRNFILKFQSDNQYFDLLWTIDDDISLNEAESEMFYLNFVKWFEINQTFFKND